MGVWQFIQDQVFGMKWLNELIGKGLSLLSLDIGECPLCVEVHKARYALKNVMQSQWPIFQCIWQKI